MENGADIAYGQAPHYGDMWNGVHPYKTGYAKMANVLLNGDSHGSAGLVDFLPVCSPPVSPVPPSFVSPDHATLVAGVTETFTVQTTGIPTPAISLSGALPADVLFEDNGDGTAIIFGTPSVGSAGTYTPTLSTSNGVAPDATQAFTLIVKVRVHMPLVMKKQPPLGPGFWHCRDSASSREGQGAARPVPAALLRR